MVLGVGNGSAVAHPSDQLKELDMNARILSITAAALGAFAQQSQPSAQPEQQPRAGEAGQAGHAGGHTRDPAAVASLGEKPWTSRHMTRRSCCAPSDFNWPEQSETIAP